MIRNFRIGKQERGFLYKDNSFHRYLKPGNHHFFDPFFTLSLSKVSTKRATFEHPDAMFLLKNKEVSQDIKVVDIQDHQRGLVFIDGHYHKILSPGLYGFFQDYFKIEVELIDLKEPEFQHPKLNLILKKENYQQELEVLVVQENYVALMLKDGKYLKTFTPGLYVFWKALGTYLFYSVCTGDQQMDVSGQEMMTKDKVSLRMNVDCTYQIQDVVKAQLQHQKSVDILYREIQLSLRQEVAARTLDELLAEREQLNQAFIQSVKTRAEELGYTLKNIGLRDIILPGEMKTILNQVVQAEKTAQANLIRRREETAATRSSLNTAKLMENNPILMRLKEFEILTEIAQKVGAIQVVGGLQALLQQLEPLATPKAIPPQTEA